MITFEAIIQEGPDGKVRFTIKTPPGTATPREMEVAFEFQAAIANLRSTKFATKVNQPWSRINDPSRQ